MGDFRNFLKKITHPFLKKGLTYYYRKPRPYTYKSITVTVHPDVFPPQLTLSTKILLDFMTSLPLKTKTFLELGCGSGIVALYARQKGAIVTASDINDTALEYLKTASKKNNLDIRCTHSNLFEAFSKKAFNYIFINPPYYPKTPENIKQKAWFCGPNFEYFEALFQQLPSYLGKENKTYMILSEDCAIQNIKTIALKHHVHLELIHKEKKVGEENYIYSIQSNSPNT